MAKSDKKEPVETQTEETQKEEATQEFKSDRKLILGPLAKYGVVALLMVSIIVTTAIMLNEELNTIDDQVAAMEAQIAKQNQLEQVAVKEATEETSSVDAASVTTETPVAEINVVSEIADTPAIETQTITSNKAPIETTQAAVTAQPWPAYRAFDHKSRIAEQNAFLAAQDQKHLDDFKASQEKQIEMLKEQIEMQQSRINEIEQRNQEIYKMREAAIKRIQKAREQSLNRI